MFHNSPVIKRKRKPITLDTKIKILDQLARGKGPTDVGKHFGIHEATIRTIKKNETAIRKSVCCGTKISAKSSSYIRDVAIEKMEKALVMWIEDKLQKSVQLNGITIKQTALRIYKHIKEVEPDISSQTKQSEFLASTRWMMRFLKRYALHNIIIQGEYASAANKFIDFDDLSFANIEELLANKSLCENEIIDLTLDTKQDREHITDGEQDDRPIFNAALIKEGLDIARKLGKHFKQHDPDVERAAKFQRELASLMAPYRGLYNGLRNQT